MNILPILIAAALLGAGGGAHAAACEARSGATPPAVVEIYTSEGCSSCPPAERWLNTLKGRPDVIALAFHVNYWDRLGWVDRFATPATTARQYELARAHGASGVYTPQVVLAGADWRGWGGAAVPAPRAAAGAPSLRLVRDGDALRAEVGAAPGRDGEFGGYWAVLEDDIVTRVLAGENAGATLRHDHVVRFYKPLPAWPAARPQTLSLRLEPGTFHAAQRAVFVVTDGIRPVQALALACPGPAPK